MTHLKAIFALAELTLDLIVVLWGSSSKSSTTYCIKTDFFFEHSRVASIKETSGKKRENSSIISNEPTQWLALAHKSAFNERLFITLTTAKVLHHMPLIQEFFITKTKDFHLESICSSFSLLKKKRGLNEANFDRK